MEADVRKQAGVELPDLPRELLPAFHHSSAASKTTTLVPVPMPMPMPMPMPGPGAGLQTWSEAAAAEGLSEEDCSPDGRDTRRSAAGSLSFNLSDIASNHEVENEEEATLADAICRLLRGHLDRFSPEFVMRTFESVRREASVGLNQEKASLRLMPSVGTWYHSLPIHKPLSRSGGTVGTSVGAAELSDASSPHLAMTDTGDSSIEVPDLGSSSPTSSCPMMTSDDAIPTETWRRRARSRITTMRSVVTTMRLLSAPHHAVISDLATASIEDLKELTEAAKQLALASNKVLDGVLRSEASPSSSGPFRSRAGGRATVSFAPLSRSATVDSKGKVSRKTAPPVSAATSEMSGLGFDDASRRKVGENAKNSEGDDESEKGDVSEQQEQGPMEEQEKEEEEEEEEVVEASLASMTETTTVPAKAQRLGQGADQVALRHLLRAAALVQDMMAPLQASGQLPGFLSRARFMRKGGTFQELTLKESDEICSCMEGCANLCTEQVKREKEGNGDDGDGDDDDGDPDGEGDDANANDVHSSNSEDDEGDNSKPPPVAESRSKLGRCQTCNEVYSGHGRVCAPCRRGDNQPIVRPCVGCGAFFVGHGSQCEDCLMPPREAGLKMAASSLKAASATLRNLIRSSSSFYSAVASAAAASASGSGSGSGSAPGSAPVLSSSSSSVSISISTSGKQPWL